MGGARTNGDGGVMKFLVDTGRASVSGRAVVTIEAKAVTVVDGHLVLTSGPIVAAFAPGCWVNVQSEVAGPEEAAS